MDHQDYLVMREQIETLQWEIENLNRHLRFMLVYVSMVSIMTHFFLTRFWG